jgi:signal transduction histidine kinase
LKLFSRRAPSEEAHLRTRETQPTVDEWLDAGVDPMMVLDLEGRIVAANSAAQALGDLPSTAIDGSVGVEQVFAKVRLSNGGGSPPWRPIATADGLDVLVAESDLAADERIFELRSSLRHGADNKPRDWIVRLVELTSLVAALRGQKAAVAHREQLLKLMSHDMRSPFVAILATLRSPDLQLLPEMPRQVIETTSHRALNIMDSAVRLIRAESSDYEFVPLDFAYIAEEVIDASWSLGRTAGVKLVLEPPNSELFILADRGSLTDALAGLFRTKLSVSDPGRVLRCGFQDSDLRGKPAVRFVVQDIADTAPGRGRPKASSDTSGLSRNGPDTSDDDSGFLLLKTEVRRHSGTTTREIEPGVGQTVSITLPLAEPSSFTLSDNVQNW